MALSRAALAAGVIAAALSAGCASAPPAQTPGKTAGKTAEPGAQAMPAGLHATPPGLGSLPYSDADVDFMSGMIPHHCASGGHGGLGAERMAPARTSPILCERIVVGQRDEIKLMQGWLAIAACPCPTRRQTRCT